METAPRQHLGDLDLAHAGTECFQPLNGVADEFGKPVDGLRELDERIWAGSVAT